jgi:hypothetical protein
VEVRAFQRRYVAGRPRLTSSADATTDDRGAYRISGLTPGDYVVAFVARQTAIPSAVAEAMRMPRPPNDAEAQAMTRERFAVGWTAGPASSIQAGSLVRQIDNNGPVPPIAEAGPVFVYPTQFYPAATAASRAKPVALASGQAREGVDFSLLPVRAVSVSGSVIGPEGPEPHIAVRLIPSGEDFQTELDAAATMTSASGEFTLLGVPAGDYILKILRVPRGAQPQPPAMTQIQVGTSMVMTSSSAATGPLPVPDDPTLFASAPISVGDTDVAGVVVPLRRGARLTGRIEFDGTRERPEPAALPRIPIVAERADAATSGSPFTSVPPGHADESGAFKTYGLPPGRYFIRAGGAPPGWTLKSVTSEGRDVSETPIELGAADVANVVVTFTDRPATLEGIARSAEGNADPAALVVVFPSDLAAWSDYGVNPRRLRSVRAGRDGAYSFTGLPPGEYQVAAIHEERHGNWQDPQVLEELSRTAVHVRVTEGDSTTQDVKVAGGVR